MTAPTPPSDTTQLGGLVGDYPGSAFRFVWVALGWAFAIFSFIASVIQGSWSGIVFNIMLATVCFIFYSYLRDFHAHVYEHGFAITRGGNTISSRWEDIINVEHLVTGWRLYGIIPLSRTHTWVITLASGKRAKVTPSFKDDAKLGATIHLMWLQTVVAKRGGGAS